MIGPNTETAPRRSRAISARIFVGNLNYTTTAEQLKELLSAVGEVVDVYLPSDRATGKPRGFAFVEMSSDEEAEAAIEEFNGKDLGGRPLRINAAEERPNRGGGGGGGGGGRSFGGPRRSGPPPPMSFGFDEGGFGGGGGGGSDRPQKNKGSRRGLRGKKRSL